MFATLVLFALVIIVSVLDFKHREIPDALNGLIAIVGLVMAAGGFVTVTLPGGLIGMVTGFLLTAPLFFIGAWGGGDVKLVAACGAWLGPIGLLPALVWMAFAGALLAIIAACRRERAFAYGPAIAFGALFQLTCPLAFLYLLKAIGA